MIHKSCPSCKVSHANYTCYTSYPREDTQPQEIHSKQLEPMQRWAVKALIHQLTSLARDLKCVVTIRVLLPTQVLIQMCGHVNSAQLVEQVSASKKLEVNQRPENGIEAYAY